MRFLADENVPGPVVAGLRARGHDVLYAKESMAGADDPVLLALAQTERRIVVTIDTDFGELAFRFGLPATCGVVLIRLEWSNPDEDNQIALAALTSRDDWSGSFAVIRRRRSSRVTSRPSSAAASNTAAAHRTIAASWKSFLMDAR
jgi:predicted nuclease of predicted toxin-antitoxin system